MKKKGMYSHIKKAGAESLKRFGFREKPIEPPSSEINVPFVYHAFMNNVELVSSTITNENSSELPESLIILPGKFNFYGKAYELKKEGLYRFVYPGKENRQRIIYQKNTDALLSSIAWIYSHGNSDDGRSYSEITDKALHSKIFATCGSISEWIHDLLESKDIKSRIVSSLTLDPWNSYDNGHVLIEVYRTDYNKWVVYDLDNNAYFSNKEIPLSLIEFSNYSSCGDYDIKYIASDVNIDISNYRDAKTNYDNAFLIEARFANENSLKLWYKRVMQVPMILDGKYNYFFNNANISRIESYSSYYRYMEKEQFLEKFY